MMVDNAELLRISSSEVAQRWMTNSKRYDALRKVKLILAEVHDRFENVRENGFPPDPLFMEKKVLGTEVHIRAAKKKNLDHRLSACSFRSINHRLCCFNNFRGKKIF